MQVSDIFILAVDRNFDIVMQVVSFTQNCIMQSVYSFYT